MPLLPTEHDEQRAVIAWARLHEVRHPELRLLFAIPNGARTSWSVAKRLKLEGIQAGVPDLCLPVPAKGYHGLWIEMKRLKGARLTTEQKWWHEQLTKQGYLVVTARGADRAIHWLARYLEVPGDAGRTVSSGGGSDAAEVWPAGDA